MFNLELTVNDNNCFINEVNDVKTDYTPDHQHLGYYNTNNIDWLVINEFLSWEDWNEIFTFNNSIDSCSALFYSIIVHAVSLCAPPKRKFTFQHRSSRNGSGKRKHKSYPKHIGKLSSK